MKSRLSDLVAAKDAGSIGEGVDGFVHLRDNDNSMAQNLSLLKTPIVSSCFLLPIKQVVL